MHKFYIIFVLLFVGISQTFAQQQDTVVQDTVYYNADSNVRYQQYPVAYWINDSVFVNPTDSVAKLDSTWVHDWDSTITHVDTNATKADAIQANGRTFTQIYDSISTGLIPNRIPYGVLYDQVYGWTGLRNPADSFSDPYFLYQSWLDMETSRIAPQDNGTYAQMRQTVSSEVNQGRYPLLTIHYNFAYVDSNAIANSLLSIVNGILTDNGGNTPYDVGQATMSGLPIKSLTQGDSITFEYMPGLYLTNTVDTISSITVSDAIEDFSYKFSAYGSYPVIFSTPGPHTLVVTTTYSSGTVGTEYEVLIIDARLTISPYSCNPTTSFVTSTLYFQGYSESAGTNSVADYHIFYHRDVYGNCTNKLAKPIIITDGIDAGDVRNFEGIYALLNYTDGSSSLNLGENLRDSGYDIIILNFPILGERVTSTDTAWSTFYVPDTVTNSSGIRINLSGRDGGADYVERNAYLTVRLIQIVDSTLAAEGRSDSIVVVGPSMGGLVTRYALAYMEQQDAAGVPYMKHRCRLWLSFDSPHLGADIPVALQQNLYWFGTTGGQASALDQYNLNFNAPATKQLLIDQFMFGYNNTSTFRTTFMYNLTHNGLSGSDGWPQHLRKISLVNGSGNGGTNFSPAAQILHGTYGTYTALTGIWEYLPFFNMQDFFMPSPGVSETISNNGASLTFHGIPYHYVSGSYSVTNDNTNGSMDNVPGSTHATADTIIAGFNRAEPSIGWGRSILGYNTFIPTISALAFINPNFNWNNPVNNRNLVCTNEIPFDNYYVQNSSQPHVTLTSDNVSWLMQELQKGEPNCTMPCPDAWPNYLCNYSTYSLSFDGLPTGATVSWSTVDASLRVNTATGNPGSITAQRYFVYSGDTATTVIATVTNPCGADYVFEKKFLVDMDGIDITGPAYACAGENEYFVSDIPPEATCRIGYSNTSTTSPETYWGTTAGGHGDGVYLSGSIGGGIWFGGYSATTINFVLQVSCSVTCGTVGGSKNVTFVTRDYCIDHGVTRNSYPGDTTNNNSQANSELAVAPNPTNTSWTFSWPENGNTPLSIVVMDMKGSKVFGDNISSAATDYSLASESIASGIYIAKLLYSDGTQKTVKLVKL